MPDHASRLLEGLNADQQRAVTTTEGPVLVVAGPGSGKTRVLTHRIAWLIEEMGVHPGSILAVTFTNKAAREMRDRIDRLIGENSTNSLVMGTFHSLGVRILRQNPGLVADRLNLLPNFLIYDDGDQNETVRRAIVAIGQDPKQITPRRVLSRISAAKSQLMTPEEFANEVASYDDEVAARAYKEYERLLRANNAVDFDDLLGLPIRLFDHAPGLLERYQQQYRYIMVDEYQDTNRVQYVMVSALSEYYRNLFVVGDPDQSIYAWRQADIRNILDFEKDYPDLTQINLEINYRSTKRIVQAADRLIRDNEQRIERRIRTENPDGEPIALRELADQNHEAQFIVSEIRRILSSGRFRSEDIAVMYRTTAQSRVIEEAFRVTDIPYRIVGGLRFYERKEVKDMLAVLRLLHNPADRLSLERMIDNMPIGRGFGPKALEAAVTWAAANNRPVIDAFLAVGPRATLDAAESGHPIEPPAFSGPGRTGAERIGKALATMREKVGTVTLAELFDAIVEQTGYRSSFNESNDEELQRWANVLELRADLEHYDDVVPEEALAAYLEQVSLVADVDSMNDDERGQVTLITLHSAKGLEFPIVFIAGVEEGLLPISRAVEAEAFDKTPMEEERRLFYVGVTRAEKLLFLTYVASRLTYGRFQQGVPSRFLQSIPAEAIRATTRMNRRPGSGNGRQSSFEPGKYSRQVATPFTSSSSSASSPVMAAATPKVELPEYKAGQRVFHPKFGEGTIMEALPRRDDIELAVRFQRHGDKRLMGSLARLEIVNE
ncbi:MAG: UvrD-helicase domain-containing protein [Thermomicrobiales bacterium]